MFNENNNEDENCLRVIIILTQTRQTFAEYLYIAIARMCRPDGSESGTIRLSALVSEVRVR